MNLLVYQATVCLAECEVCLGDRPYSPSDRPPIVIEVINGVFTPDLFHTNGVEARFAEQTRQPPWIGERP